MPLNLQKIIVSINSSLIIVLLSRIFFYQMIYFTSSSHNRNFYKFIGIRTNKTYSFIRKKKTFFVSLLKALATISLFPLLLSISLGSPDIVIKLRNWFSINSFSFNFELHYDLKFNLFFFTALAVSSSIVEFSNYYMETDPKKNAFFHLLVIFLLNMIILTLSKNLFFLFIGWEGVGFLSFLLISWWQTRTNAKKAALQAVIYNRIGDIGLLLFFALALISFKSWSLSEVRTIKAKETFRIKLLLIGALIAAAGKSAQFGLHPWLPAAMEGPTPVSALLHRSTMVVAGIFLLIRISPIYSACRAFNRWCLILGAVTAIFAATTAISQHDIKKIIAYSTTSQLGLMMVAIGLNNPRIALFHICTHAFFKAMLFLSSGRIIHSLGDEQDLRKMGGLFFILPKTSACIILGSLALAGTPFLAGFYSKDLILETSLTRLSNFFSIFISLIATLLTAVYSLRIILFCFGRIPSFKPLSPTREENKNLIKSLNRLAIGTIISGWTISTFVLFNAPITLQLVLKSLAFGISSVAAFYSYFTIKTLMTSLYFSPLLYNLKRFTTLQWFYQKTAHFVTSFTSFLASLTLRTRKIDQGWKENIGAQGIAYTSSTISKTYQLTQTGYIKHYLTMSSFIFIIIVFIMFLSF